MLLRKGFRVVGGSGRVGVGRRAAGLRAVREVAGAPVVVETTPRPPPGFPLVARDDPWETGPSPSRDRDTLLSAEEYDSRTGVVSHECCPTPW